MDTKDHTYRDLLSIAMKRFLLDESEEKEWWEPRAEAAAAAWGGAGYPVLLTISFCAVQIRAGAI